MEVAFWISFAGVTYAYFGYPLLLMLIGVGVRSSSAEQLLSPENAPDVSLIIPAHNEAEVIGRKLDNSLSLYYPGKLQVVVVSDGSTDATSEIVSSYCGNGQVDFTELPERRGKASALNKGVELAQGDIVVFSDASIILEKQALWEIVRPFADAGIGCVSGEDLIEGGGGEGLYGKYELFLRRQESKSGSIVGASGSFYAQRKSLIVAFPEGVAPDFLSVLNTVKSGYRAISSPRAIGYMTAAKDSRDEFRRKTRTVIRGMAALFEMKQLLNPMRHGLFSFFLLSHKVARWHVPFLLLSLLLTNLFLLEESIYQVFFVGQLLFYVSALLGHFNIANIATIPIIRVALYFTVSNVAILIAWTKYFRGVRQEIWGPTKRSNSP